MGFTYDWSWRKWFQVCIPSAGFQYQGGTHQADPVFFIWAWDRNSFTLQMLLGLVSLLFEHCYLPFGWLQQCPKRIWMEYVLTLSHISKSSLIFLYLIPQSAIQGSGCTNRAIMLWGVCEFLWATDRPSLRLGSVLQKRAHDGGTASLLAYSQLSSSNLAKNRVNYKVRPKWYLQSHFWVWFKL